MYCSSLGEILAGQKVLRSCTACFLPLTGAKTGSFTAFSGVLRSTTVVVLRIPILSTGSAAECPGADSANPRDVWNCLRGGGF